MLACVALLSAACDAQTARSEQERSEHERSARVLVRRPDASSRSEGVALRLHVLASLSGALEPCGCRADMLGGLDHAAAIVAAAPGDPPSMLVAVGTTLFASASLESRKRGQDLLRARTIAGALADMKLAAWTPGLDDFVAGTAELASLGAQLGAPLVAANLTVATPRPVPGQVLRRGGIAIGVTGVVLADAEQGLPTGVQLDDAASALQRAHERLVRDGSEVELVLIAGTPDAAHALIARVPGFDLALLGSARAEPEDDEPSAPHVTLGTTQVLAPRGHAHALATVDFVRRSGRIELEVAPELEVREARGSSGPIAARIASYHAHVERLNRSAALERGPSTPSQVGYVGVEACGACHDAALAFWNNTAHARAYFTLVDRHREHDLDCVPCHVTGYDRPGGVAGTQPNGLQAVQCETCHGPGARHAETGARDAIVRAPSRDTCRDCHRPPHVLPTWNADAAWHKTVGVGHGE